MDSLRRQATRSNHFMGSERNFGKDVENTVGAEKLVKYSSPWTAAAKLPEPSNKPKASVLANARMREFTAAGALSLDTVVATGFKWGVNVCKADSTFLITSIDQNGATLNTKGDKKPLKVSLATLTDQYKLHEETADDLRIITCTDPREAHGARLEYNRSLARILMHDFVGQHFDDGAVEVHVKNKVKAVLATKSFAKALLIATVPFPPTLAIWCVVTPILLLTGVWTRGAFSPRHPLLLCVFLGG